MTPTKGHGQRKQYVPNYMTLTHLHSSLRLVESSLGGSRHRCFHDERTGRELGPHQYWGPFYIRTGECPQLDYI